MKRRLSRFGTLALSGGLLAACGDKGITPPPPVETDQHAPVVQVTQQDWRNGYAIVGASANDIDAKGGTLTLFGNKDYSFSGSGISVVDSVEAAQTFSDQSKSYGVRVVDAAGKSASATAHVDIPAMIREFELNILPWDIQSAQPDPDGGRPSYSMVTEPYELIITNSDGELLDSAIVSGTYRNTFPESTLTIRATPTSQNYLHDFVPMVIASKPDTAFGTTRKVDAPFDHNKDELLNVYFQDTHFIPMDYASANNQPFTDAYGEIDHLLTGEYGMFIRRENNFVFYVDSLGITQKERDRVQQFSKVIDECNSYRVVNPISHEQKWMSGGPLPLDSTRNNTLQLYKKTNPVFDVNTSFANTFNRAVSQEFPSLGVGLIHIDKTDPYSTLVIGDGLSSAVGFIGSGGQAELIVPGNPSDNVLTPRALRGCKVAGVTYSGLPF